MTYQPLSSGDQSKIMLFILTMLPALLLIFGVLPALFLVFGMIMMKKNNDFSHVLTAVRNCKVYFLVLLIISILFVLFFASKLDSFTAGLDEGYTQKFARERFNGFLIFICVIFLYMFLIKKLFLSPLVSHADWVAENGIFSSNPKKTKRHSETADIDIIKGERLRSFSVADELIKWARLREDGHISEQEFNDVRKKLLQRD